MRKIIVISAIVGLMIFMGNAVQAVEKAYDRGQFNVVLKDGEIRNINMQELPEYMRTGIIQAEFTLLMIMLDIGKRMRNRIHGIIFVIDMLPIYILMYRIFFIY